MGKLQKAMANLIKDSLQQLSDQPIVKGLFPTLLGTSLSRIEHLLGTSFDIYVFTPPP